MATPARAQVCYLRTYSSVKSVRSQTFRWRILCVEPLPASPPTTAFVLLSRAHVMIPSDTDGRCEEGVAGQGEYSWAGGWRMGSCQQR